MPPLDEYLAATSHDAFERDLFELLRIASISAKSDHRADVGRAAQWVADQFGQLGADGRTGSKRPAIRSSMPNRRPCPAHRPCWSTAITTCSRSIRWPSGSRRRSSRRCRDGNVYARGATDDKGQMLTHVKSAEAWLAAVGRLPVQLKFVIEGEEEVGSRNLDAVPRPPIASGWPATWS